MTGAHDDLVKVDVRAIDGAPGSVATLTLNRPDQLNAITWDMVDAFNSAITEVLDRDDLRAVLVTGEGRSFSAGGDLKAYRVLQRDPELFPRFVDDLHAAFGRLRTLRVPVIALINGVTAAGGLELALNCDMSIMASSARIGDGHLNFGQMGGGGVLTLLPRMIGISRANELLFSGRLLSAEEALAWGLVGHVVPDEELIPRGLAIVEQIARKSPLAVANAKYVMATVWSESVPLSVGLRIERERNALYCLTSVDAPEGLSAFAEKRAPRFVGR